jgi:hypothetical protein
MAGLWEISAKNPVYLQPQEKSQPYGQPFGICISDVRFQGGEAKVKVCFPKTANGRVDPDSSGGILFGFRSLSDEYFYAAVGGYDCAYVLARFTGSQWIAFATAGSQENLIPEHPYTLSVRVSGQRVIFEVDDVQCSS